MATKLFLAGDPAADKLLASDPLALLIGMLLDQQIPLEKAFTGPHILTQRMGVTKLDAAQIAAYDPEKFAELFATVPAIHRFPGSMAERTQKLCQAVAAEYDGDAERIWATATDGRDLLKRMEALPGFGKQKAQIFVALLGKQFGVQPAGWREAAGVYGEEGSHRSVADIVSKESLAEVREYKKQMKAAAKK
ncbi:HhH-GPD-type base excision DNA repair protein [Hamadaea tsunoensis]|uniref:HhH-GPD-type base excision DNA repair protein n=1 Tax=Hamadaea tsunoensis TaxID=53368 RepID=UPI0003FDF562|nr:HhH-GPD-type base excision DNA repair protein [Hamadaea tsunoensis]